MPAGNFSIVIEGLKDLQDSLSQEKVNKELSVGVGLFARKLHSDLRFSIKQMYDMGKNPKNLDSVLANNPSSIQKFGNVVIQASLEYKRIPIPLSQFPHSYFWGNINKPPAKRKGTVFSTRVRRGQTKIVYGKNHNGGFIPVLRSGKEALSPNGRLNMYERINKNRYSTRLLFGSALADQAFYALTHDPQVIRSLENLEQFIADNINL